MKELHQYYSNTYKEASTRIDAVVTLVGELEVNISVANPCLAILPDYEENYRRSYGLHRHRNNGQQQLTASFTLVHRGTAISFLTIFGCNDCINENSL